MSEENKFEIDDEVKITNDESEFRGTRGKIWAICSGDDCEPEESNYDVLLYGYGNHVRNFNFEELAAVDEIAERAEELCSLLTEEEARFLLHCNAIQTYDTETIEDLREAVWSCYKDGDFSIGQLEGVADDLEVAR